MPVNPIATAFSVAVENYERGRPEYPEAALAALTQGLGISGSSRVVELGAGSGKFTRSLLREGVAPVALEPIPEMRAELHRRLPTIPLIGATAEVLPLRDRTVDAAVAAQAFHWFRPEPTMAELARVVRSGGGVGLVWNLRDEEVEWVARFGDLLRAHEPPGTPSYREGGWKRAFEGSPEFAPLERREFRHRQSMDLDTAVARALSVSYVAALPAPTRTEVAHEIATLIHTETATRDRATFDFPYRTEVYWSRRR